MKTQPTTIFEVANTISSEEIRNKLSDIRRNIRIKQKELENLKTDLGFYKLVKDIQITEEKKNSQNVPELITEDWDE